jgi:hypothetical protein
MKLETATRDPCNHAGSKEVREMKSGRISVMIDGNRFSFTIPAKKTTNGKAKKSAK